MSGVPLRRLATLITAPGEGQLPLLTLEDLMSGEGAIRPGQVLATSPHPAAGLAQLEPGDVCFGKLRPYLAKSYRVTSPLRASTELIAMRPGPLIDSRYLALVVRSGPFVDWAMSSSDGTKMPRTSWEKLGSFRVDLPAIEHQQRIADHLDAETARIDALIAKRQRQIELLGSRKWAALADDVGRVESWTPLRRYIHSLTDGPFGSAFSSADYSEEGAAVIRLGNIGFGEFRGQDLARIPMDLFRQFGRHHVLAGDLVMAGLGDDRNHAGRACVAPMLGPAMVKGKCFRARVTEQMADADFVALYLSSPMAAQQIALATRGSTRAMINLEVVAALLVPGLEPARQAAIARRVRTVESKVTDATVSLDRQIDLLRERRQALITAMVTGMASPP